MTRVKPTTSRAARICALKLLETLCKIAGISPAISIDPDFYRPTDRPAILCTKKIQSSVGWQPEYTLDQTLRDIYAEVSERLSRESA